MMSLWTVTWTCVVKFDTLAHLPVLAVQDIKEPSYEPTTTAATQLGQDFKQAKPKSPPTNKTLTPAGQQPGKTNSSSPTAKPAKKAGGNDYSDPEESHDYALIKRTRRKKILKTKDNVKESHGRNNF